LPETVAAAGGVFDERLWVRLRWPATLLALAVIAAAVAAIVLPAVSIGLYFERSWNEGWNAYQQARAVAGAALYAADPWRPVNYPFLSFYLAGWLGPLFGNVLVAGRVLNLGALAAVVAFGALFVKRCGGGLPEILFAAGCVLGFQEIQAPDWLAVDEPQMLAEAFVLAGLLCYVAGPPSFVRLLCCALCFAAGGFTKQIVVAFPAAVSIDLLLCDRRHFLSWVVCLGLALALFAAASAMVAGGDFLARVFQPRPWLWQHVLYHAERLFFFLKAPVAASVIVLCRPLPRGRAVLLRAAGVTALAGGLAFAGGDGVSVNVFLEPTVLMGLLAGLALAQWRHFSAASRAAAAITLLLPLFFASPILARAGRSLTELRDFAASWRTRQVRQAEFLAASAWLRAQPGEALCESLLLCFAAGKPLVVDPWGAREEIMTGRAAEAPLLRAIAAHRFAIVALPYKLHPGGADPDVLTRGRFTRATLAAIDRYYAPEVRLPGVVFYTPRRGCAAACVGRIVPPDRVR
jgi:hypothetical protein